ncbi:hypothetical protein Moror_16891 [Moniliophthora roreri MCA 2997]|uniref:F-box domain-containing protein n=1 Tax=Moniliophthora roreri (strain MCA 2997) TaxID=1381753 RepID=V2WS95_MONRO|nr:hypothetical protein Moror_16891 [Moniliophthora roreri MCA 2997]
METLKLYGRELERIRDVLDKLKADKAFLQQQIEERSAMISPLRRVPVEIWQRIFSLVCSSDGRSEFTLAMQYRLVAPAYHISLVSSHWREIAVNYPPIWQSIMLDLGCPSWAQGGNINLRALLSIYLKNAGTGPSKVLIFDSHRDLGNETNVQSISHLFGMGLLRILLTRMGSCSEFTLLGISGYSLSEDVLGGLNLSFPALRSLEIQLDMEGVPFEPTLQFWQAIAAAPLLKHLSGSYLPPTIPYHQLASLWYWEIQNHGQFLQIVSQCQRIESLSFRWDPEPPGSVIPLSCTLPFLQELTILSSCSLEILSSLLDALHAPALTDLSVTFGYFQGLGTPYTIPHSFLSVLNRLSDTLQVFSLDLTAVWPTNSSMSDILAVLPNLRSFSVLLSGAADLQEVASPCVAHLVTSLTISLGSPRVIAPKLTKLSLHERKTRVNSSIIDRVLTMAESRSKGGLTRSGMESKVAALGHVNFSYWSLKAKLPFDRVLDDLLTPDDHKRIEGLKEDGTVCRLEEKWIM